MSYGITLPEFWTGPTGRAIREHGGAEAQVLGMYLCSNRWANMLGFYRLLPQDMCLETGLSLDAIARGFRVLAEADFAEYDTQSSCVWVRTMARVRLNLRADLVMHPNDHRVAALNRLYQALPPNPFLSRFYDTYAKVLQLSHKRQAHGEVVAMGVTDAPSGADDNADHAPSQGTSEGPTKKQGASHGPTRKTPSEGASKGHPTTSGRGIEGPSRGAPEASDQISRSDQIDQISRSDQIDQENSSARQKRAPEEKPKAPTNDAFRHYFERFEALYRAKPNLDRDKDAGRMKRLLAETEGGLNAVCARIDAYFDPRGDPFWSKCRHGLDLFFSVTTQNKLIAFMSGVPEEQMSETMRHNLAAVAEGKKLILGRRPL